MDYDFRAVVNQVEQIAASQPEYTAGEAAERRRSARGNLSRLERFFAAVIAVGAIVFVASVLWRVMT